jgi:4-hydroxyphenylpyruvate dioxygenase-like putative hemolysin
MINKIDHVNIVVSNLENTTAFFVSLLGFHETKSGHLEGDWISKVVGLNNVKAKYVQLSLKESETNLELIQYYSPSDNTPPSENKSNLAGLRHIAFDVTDIETHYDNLEKAGINIYSDIQTYQNKKKLFYFQGPENVILELCSYI